MAVHPTTDMKVANYIYAALFLAFWASLSFAGYFLRGNGRSRRVTLNHAISQMMFFLAAGYALVGFLIGMLLVNRQNNLLTIIGGDPVGAVLDVHIALQHLQMGIVAVYLSYYYAQNFAAMAAAVAIIIVTHDFPLFLILRAYFWYNLMWWSIVGGCSLAVFCLVMIFTSRIMWAKVDKWITWFPILAFLITRVAFWVTVCLSNTFKDPITPQITEWLYPAYSTFEVIYLAFFAQFAVKKRTPGYLVRKDKIKWSWSAIYYITAQDYAEFGSPEDDAEDMATEKRYPGHQSDMEEEFQ